MREDFQGRIEGTIGNSNLLKDADVMVQDDRVADTRLLVRPCLFSSERRHLRS